MSHTEKKLLSSEENYFDKEKMIKQHLENNPCDIQINIIPKISKDEGDVNTQDYQQSVNSSLQLNLNDKNSITSETPVQMNSPLANIVTNCASPLNPLSAPTLSFPTPIDILNSLKLANEFEKQSHIYKTNFEEKTRQQIIAERQRVLAQLPIYPLVINIINYDTDAFLPQDLTNTAKSISQMTGLEYQGLNYSILGAVSLATLGKINIKVYNYWQESVVLMIIQIAESGRRKSAAADILRHPFEQFCDEKNVNFDQNYYLAKEKNSEHKKLVDQFTSMRRGEIVKLGSKMPFEDMLIYFSQEVENLTAIKQASGNYNKIPKLTKILVDKATPFQLATELSRNDECLGCITAEGDMISSINKHSNDCSIFLKCYTQEPYVYINARSNISLNHPAFPMINLVQPEIAINIYSNGTLNNLGFSPRLTPFFYNAANVGQSHNVDQNWALQNYFRKIKLFLEMFYSDDTNAPRYVVGMTAEAMQKIHNFEQEITCNIMPRMPKESEACLRKAHGLAIRFAWCVHLWNNGANYMIDIDEREIEQGIMLVKALLPHIAYAYDPYGFQSYIVAQKIIASIWHIDSSETNKLMKEGLDSRTLQQRTGYKSREVNNALHLLAKHNYLLIYDDGTSNLKIALHPNFFCIYKPMIMQK